MWTRLLAAPQRLQPVVRVGSHRPSLMRRRSLTTDGSVVCRSCRIALRALELLDARTASRDHCHTKVGDSVKLALEEWGRHIRDDQQARLESATLHACNAVDGTARQRVGTEGSQRLEQILREGYDVLLPMYGLDYGRHTRATRRPPDPHPGPAASCRRVNR